MFPPAPLHGHRQATVHVEKRGRQYNNQKQLHDNDTHCTRTATSSSPDVRPWEAPRCIRRSHREWGQCTPQHGDSYRRPSLAEGSTGTCTVGERPDHDPRPIRRTDPGVIVVSCIAYIHSHTSPHRLAHTAEIRTAVGGVLVRSCSGADLRLPGIPRRIRGGPIRALSES